MRLCSCGCPGCMPVRGRGAWLLFLTAACCTFIATADTRAYTARYDRIYVRGLEATAYQLIANKPLTPAGGHCMPWNGGHVVCVVLLAHTCWAVACSA